MPSFALARQPRLTMTTLLRALAAGSAWGIVVTAGFGAIALHNCGMICPDDVAITAATSVGVGVLTIGPLALFGAPR
jgi:hypothetical protein